MLRWREASRSHSWKDAQKGAWEGSLGLRAGMEEDLRDSFIVVDLALEQEWRVR